MSRGETTVVAPSYSELERAIASVPGVAEANVGVSPETGRGRLRIRLAPGEDPEAVSWAVAATLRERFGIALDPDDIRPRAAHEAEPDVGAEPDADLVQVVSGDTPEQATQEDLRDARERLSEAAQDALARLHGSIGRGGPADRAETAPRRPANALFGGERPAPEGAGEAGVADTVEAPPPPPAAEEAPAPPEAEEAAAAPPPEAEEAAAPPSPQPEEAAAAPPSEAEEAAAPREPEEVAAPAAEAPEPAEAEEEPATPPPPAPEEAAAPFEPEEAAAPAEAEEAATPPPPAPEEAAAPSEPEVAAAAAAPDAEEAAAPPRAERAAPFEDVETVADLRATMAAASRRRRAAIRDLVTRHSPDSVEVLATLRLGNRDVDGQARGVPTEAGILRAVAEATVDAVRTLTGERVLASVDDVTVAWGADPATARVVVSVLGDDGEETLLGAALLRGDLERTVMRATLDALNRRLEPLLLAGR